MFLHNPALDVCMFFVCLYLFRVFILVDETANEDVKLLAKHSNCCIRLGLWICVLGSVIYMTLSDFSTIDGRYYAECVHIPFAVAYLLAIYSNFVCYKYGPKDEAYRQKNLLQLQAIIALPCIFLLMYFFM